MPSSRASLPRVPRRPSGWRGRLVWSLCAVFAGGAGPAGAEHVVKDPAASRFLVESEHFVARGDDRAAVRVSDEAIRKGLATLEEVRRCYLDAVGFPAPYADDSERYKTDVFLSDRGWASGSGTGARHPAMWLHYDALADRHALAHEFAHCLQFASGGLRDSEFVGWFWESHAEWMTHQFDPAAVGCSEQLVDSPHLAYGSTRNRYGNWQFWEFIKDRHGRDAVTRIWTTAHPPGHPQQGREDPILVLARHMGWDSGRLGDEFGTWALHNVTWDYTHGGAFRRAYGDYDDRSGTRRNRVTLLDPVDPARGRYRVPAYRAPQRFGYNLVRIDPEPAAGDRTVTVRFRGLVQQAAGRAGFTGAFACEPEELAAPGSDWRWALVAVDADGRPRYGPLQRGGAATSSMPLRPADRALWLVVVATPTTAQRIRWDQAYYSVYRYPWAIEVDRGRPRGSGPGPQRPTAERRGRAHPHGGGWVDETARVDPGVWVGPEAMVLDTARVSGRARIEGRAVVGGEADVADEAVVRDRAEATGTARLRDHARLEGDAVIRAGLMRDRAVAGALTIIDGAGTELAADVQVHAVMNTIRDVRLSGRVQLRGDVELHAAPQRGVFYGIVLPEMVTDPRFGARRSEPEPEVTTEPPGWPETPGGDGATDR